MAYDKEINLYFHMNNDEWISKFDDFEAVTCCYSHIACSHTHHTHFSSCLADDETNESYALSSFDDL